MMTSPRPNLEVQGQLPRMAMMLGTFQLSATKVAKHSSVFNV